MGKRVEKNLEIEELYHSKVDSIHEHCHGGHYMTIVRKDPITKANIKRTIRISTKFYDFINSFCEANETRKTYNGE